MPTIFRTVFRPEKSVYNYCVGTLHLIKYMQSLIHIELTASHYTTPKNTIGFILTLAWLNLKDYQEVFVTNVHTTYIKFGAVDVKEEEVKVEEVKGKPKGKQKGSPAKQVTCFLLDCYTSELVTFKKYILIKNIIWRKKKKSEIFLNLSRLEKILVFQSWIIMIYVCKCSKKNFTLFYSDRGRGLWVRVFCHIFFTKPSSLKVKTLSFMRYSINYQKNENNKFQDIDRSKLTKCILKE